MVVVVAAAAILVRTTNVSRRNHCYDQSLAYCYQDFTARSQLFTKTTRIRLVLKCCGMKFYCSWKRSITPTTTGVTMLEMKISVVFVATVGMCILVVPNSNLPRTAYLSLTNVTIISIFVVLLGYVRLAGHQ